MMLMILLFLKDFVSVLPHPRQSDLAGDAYRSGSSTNKKDPENIETQPPLLTDEKENVPSLIIPMKFVFASIFAAAAVTLVSAAPHYHRPDSFCK